MTLNATIIIQIINFLLAYLIIDRILLRKVVGIIQHDRQERATLMKDIELQRDKVAEREQVKTDRWQQFRHQFSQKVPKIQEIPSVKKVDVPVKLTISPADVEWYAGQLKHALIKKVDNAPK